MSPQDAAVIGHKLAQAAKIAAWSIAGLALAAFIHVVRGCWQ